MKSETKTQLSLCLAVSLSSYSLSLHLYHQVAEKILDGKELEFYKWDGELSQLLQNVRNKLNRVAEVCTRVPSFQTYSLQDFRGFIVSWQNTMIHDGFVINQRFYAMI